MICNKQTNIDTIEEYRIFASYSFSLLSLLSSTSTLLISSKPNMFPSIISNSTSLPEDSSSTQLNRLNHVVSTINSSQQPQKTKKKRNLPGNPDPDAEVIALSPKTLLATNRFVCEICNKGFQRDQNLQLHRRGHNLPWKLKQRNNKEVIKKRAYVCPEPSCVHHNPLRALGDLTGIKKHFSRKHGEKKWKCDKCSKIYAVQSDWKAHSKTCGTREYKCDCGTLFSRKDSFITHRAFCDALAEESARMTANQLITNNTQSLFLFPTQQNFQNHLTWVPQPPPQQNPNPNPNTLNASLHQNNIIKHETQNIHNNNNNLSPSFLNHHHTHTNNKSNIITSATALLQKAATVGSAPIIIHDHYVNNIRGLTRDFLGLTNGGGGQNAPSVDVSIHLKDMLTFTGGVDQHQQNMLFKSSDSQQGFGFFGTTTVPESWNI